MKISIEQTKWLSVIQVVPILPKYISSIYYALLSGVKDGIGNQCTDVKGKFPMFSTRDVLCRTSPIIRTELCPIKYHVKSHGLFRCCTSPKQFEDCIYIYFHLQKLVTKIVSIVALMSSYAFENFRVLFQYPIRRLIVRSRRVAKPPDLCLELSDRFDI